MVKDPLKSRAAANCPICGQATKPDWRPFCSRRCADIDLGRWMTGSYAIPSDEEPGPEDNIDPDVDGPRH